MDSNKKRTVISIGIWEREVYEKIMLNIPIIDHKAISIRPKSLAENTYPILESDENDSFTILLEDL